MRSKIFHLSVLAISIILLISILNYSCKGKEYPPIKLFIIADQTGPIALYGKWSVEGIQIAMDEINAGGGIDGRRVQMALEDGQTNPQAGLSAFQKFVSLNKPPVVIVATNTGTVMVCAPIANEKKIVVFAPASSGPNVTDAGDFVFRNRVSGYYESLEMARFAAGTLKLKYLGVAVLNNELGQGYIDAFKISFELNDRKVVEAQMLDQGKTDFRTQIIKMKNANPEAVFLALPVREAATFIKQSTELGFKPKWLSMTTIQSSELFDIAGSAADGLIFVAEGGDESNPIYREFARKYKARYGSEPTMNAMNGYDAVMLLAPMIAKNMTGPEIRDALYKTKNYQGAGGVLSFDKNGDANKPLILMIAKNGKFERLK